MYTRRANQKMSAVPQLTHTHTKKLLFWLPSDELVIDMSYYGRYVATRPHESADIHVYEVTETAALKLRFKLPSTGQVTFSPRGDAVACVPITREMGAIQVWNKLDFPSPYLKLSIKRIGTGDWRQIQHVVWSDDARFLSARVHHSPGVCDIEVWAADRDDHFVSSWTTNNMLTAGPVFTVNDHFVAFADENGKVYMGEMQTGKRPGMIVDTKGASITKLEVKFVHMSETNDQNFYMYILTTGSSKDGQPYAKVWELKYPPGNWPGIEFFEPSLTRVIDVYMIDLTAYPLSQFTFTGNGMHILRVDDGTKLSWMDRASGEVEPGSTIYIDDMIGMVHDMHYTSAALVITPDSVWRYELIALERPPKRTAA